MVFFPIWVFDTVLVDGSLPVSPLCLSLMFFDLWRPVGGSKNYFFHESFGMASFHRIWDQLMQNKWGVIFLGHPLHITPLYLPHYESKAIYEETRSPSQG